jgi:hypothetical protein
MSPLLALLSRFISLPRYQPPILNLPDEVLDLILVSYCNVPDEYATATTPAQVCRRFRAIALRNPLLWANIDLLHPRRVPDLLARSQDATLRVRYEYALPAPRSRADHRRRDAWVTRAGAAWDAVLAHAHRVDDLCFSGDEARIIAGRWTTPLAGPRHEFARLAAITITSGGARELHELLGAHGFPALCALHVPGTLMRGRTGGALTHPAVARLRALKLHAPAFAFAFAPAPRVRMAALAALDIDFTTGAAAPGAPRRAARAARPAHARRAEW